MRDDDEKGIKHNDGLYLRRGRAHHHGMDRIKAVVWIE